MAKQLSLSDRYIIERSLNKDYTFATIARILERSPSTISREILKYRVFVDKFPMEGSNDCTKRGSCLKNTLCSDAPPHGCYFYRCKSCPDHQCFMICDSYESVRCDKLKKPPYVCSGCQKQKSCKKNHAYYSAHRAEAEHKKNMRDSHSGIRKTPEELIEIGHIIAPLLNKGQSLNHICATHAEELGVSERTLYNYVDAGVFKVRNLDLPKKCVYRKRRPAKVLTKMEYQYRRGRTIEDFNSYVEANPGISIVEMDTVKGTVRKGKVFLTMIFRDTNFMLIFLMNDGTQKSVQEVFDSLTSLLGLDTFRKLFQVILTDNGVEFKNPHELEHAPNGCQRTRIFFCDPQASWQKPHVEKNHVLIRRILPKGTPFTNLTKKDVNVLMCHINSVIREQMDNQTPFDRMKKKEQKKLLSSLDLFPIPPDEVILKPDLLKQ